MLARKEVDAVAIATGNRWHGLGSMYAARLAKTLLREPITLTIGEGRKLVDTCRRFWHDLPGGTQRPLDVLYGFCDGDGEASRIGRLNTVEMQVWEGPGIPHDKVADRPQRLGLRRVAGPEARGTLRARPGQRLAVLLGHRRGRDDGHGRPLH